MKNDGQLGQINKVNTDYGHHSKHNGTLQSINKTMLFCTHELSQTVKTPYFELGGALQNLGNR